MTVCHISKDMAFRKSVWTIGHLDPAEEHYRDDPDKYPVVIFFDDGYVGFFPTESSLFNNTVSEEEFLSLLKLKSV